MFGVITFALKVSILLQYIEIFVPLKTSNDIFWACHSIIWANLVFYTTVFFLQIFGCRPVERIWNPYVHAASCINGGSILDSAASLYTASRAINAASDIIILVLPQLVIRKLQMSSQKKIGISVVFLFGVL